SSISPGKLCPSHTATGLSSVSQSEDWYYTIVFNAGDLTAITATVEAGIGVMVAPLRAVLQGRIRRQTPSGACRSFHFSRRSAERHGQKAGAASGKGNRRHRCLCAE
ncbi:MAG: hypothetical protein WBE14_03130, partial [Xanthobacteraceae bacterium]